MRQWPFVGIARILVWAIAGLISGCFQSTYDLGKFPGNEARPSVWAQPWGADHRHSAQGAVPTLAVSEPPALDPRHETLKRELQDDLARLRRRWNYVIAADVGLWVGCFGSAALSRNVEVTAVLCCIGGSGHSPIEVHPAGYLEYGARAA